MQKKHWIALIALIIFSTGLFLPVNLYMIYEHPHNDFDEHIDFARQWMAGGEMPEHIAAHPVWQIGIRLVRRVLGISLESAAVLLQISLQILLAVGLFFLFRQWIPSLSPFLLILLPWILMIITPIMLLWFEDGLFYLGYIGINTHHNPTINMLKPFALLLFVYAAGLGQGKQYAWQHIAAAAILVSISTLVKPNFIICLLPALGLILFIRLVRREVIDWKFTLLGFVLPAVVVLAWQFFLTYGADQGGVLLAPFVVMKAYSDFLLLKLVLSIWFPLLASLVYFKQALRNPSMVLAWITFFFGAAFTYLLAEEGDRLLHANWGWSGEITLFVLIVITVLFFFQQWKENRRKTIWLLLLFLGFLPHAVAGIVYLVYVFTSGTFL